MGEVFNDSETDIKRCIVMIFHCFDALELCGIRKIIIEGKVRTFRHGRKAFKTPKQRCFK
jgi:hypothetical protein